MKKKKWKILILIFLIFILIILVFFIFKNKSATKIINITNSPPPLSSPLIRGRLGKGLAIFEINNAKYQSEIEGEISVADFMEKLKREGKINYKEKNYISMGKFIEEINGVKNSGEKNWIYYVNGKKANIGVSNYKINSGDIVSWKYEKENF